jgi:hypothetical protein
MAPSQTETAQEMLPSLSACDTPTEVFSGITFHFDSRHALYERVRFIITSHGGVMVALRDLAAIRLADHEDDWVRPGSTSLSLLRAHPKADGLQKRTVYKNP